MLRVDAGIGLRELAARIGVSSAYLSRVEHGRDPPPTPDRLAAIADALRLPRAVLFDLAQQTGPAVSGYLARIPEAGLLLLELARRDLGRAELARIRAFVETEFPSHEPNRRRAQLGELLSPRQVVLQVACDDLDDAIAVATSRMPSASRRRVAEAIVTREREAPSAIGGGFVAPHAIVPGVTETAALLVFARPLPIEAPDREPVRVALVLVTPTAGARHQQLLANVSLLARRGATADLLRARTPQGALDVVVQIESTF
ncbi:MAG: PTS sugar transporter subunit IIA [Nannocystaceae bacterium]|nr:PTS sugar transporter subunit IIA [Nannocystaceae bacterium]